MAEIHPELPCWPSNPEERAHARSVSCEMHSGFLSLRNTLHMNCRKHMTFARISEPLRADINRICGIWKSCQEKHSVSGPFLFGGFTIADAMYAPVVLRFNSYGIDVGETEKEYMNSILSLDSMQEWITEGIAEKELLPECEVEA